MTHRDMPEARRTQQPDGRPVSPARSAAAWSVHLLTASGAVWGLLALAAAHGGSPREAFGWLGIALIVDGIDGSLASWVGTRRVVPQIDGELLDNLIDYLNYVFVPAVLIERGGYLPAGTSMAGAATICLVSAFQFSHRHAKSDDSFLGFPSYWNVVAAYFFLLEPPPAWALGSLLVLSVLVFAPVRFVYPSRTVELRIWTWSLMLPWLALLAISIVRQPSGSHMWAAISLLFPLYYGLLSLGRTYRA